MERGAGRAEDPDRAEIALTPGASPALRQAIRYAVLTPITVGRSSSASRHCSSRSGHAGSPSSITIEPRRSSPEPARSRSSRPWSRTTAAGTGLDVRISPWCLVLDSWPPCPCTIALGRPVVPDEKSTYSGWSERHGVELERLRSRQQLVPADRVVWSSAGTVREPRPRARGRAAETRIAAISSAALDVAVAEP